MKKIGLGLVIVAVVISFSLFLIFWGINYEDGLLYNLNFFSSYSLASIATDDDKGTAARQILSFPSDSKKVNHLASPARNLGSQSHYLVFTEKFLKELEKIPDAPIFHRNVKSDELHYDELPKRWENNNLTIQHENDNLNIHYIVGVEKCGTTDIYYQLLKSDDVVTQKGQEEYVHANAGPKESRYWEKHLDGDLTQAGFTSWIDSNFAEYRRVTAGGNNKTKFSIESTPRNFHGGNEADQLFVFSMAQIIYSFQPKAKIIIMFREPLARTWSDYHYYYMFSSRKKATTETGILDLNLESNNLLLKNSKTCPQVNKAEQLKISSSHFHSAVTNTLKDFVRCVRSSKAKGLVDDPEFYCALPHRIPHCNDGRPILSAYSIWAKEWLRVIPRDQLYFGFLDDYAKDEVGFLRSLCTFLHINTDFLAEIEKKKAAIEVENESNAGNYVFENKEDEKMHLETENLLKLFFNPFNNRLSNMIGQKLPETWNNNIKKIGMTDSNDRDIAKNFNFKANETNDSIIIGKKKNSIHQIQVN